VELTEAQLDTFLAALDADEATTNKLIEGYVQQLKRSGADRDAFQRTWETIRAKVELPVAMDIASAYGAKSVAFDWGDVMAKMFEVWKRNA
jgi:hypothetical protein